MEIYNGYHEHDMWENFDNLEHTGAQDVFVDTDIDKFIDNLNDWD